MDFQSVMQTDVAHETPSIMQTKVERYFVRGGCLKKLVLDLTLHELFMLSYMLEDPGIQPIKKLKFSDANYETIYILLKCWISNHCQQ